MKMNGLMKLVKSRSGILSALVAIVCGLLLGLIACHLYNLKKVEGFAPKDDVTYNLNIELDDKDHQTLRDLHHTFTTLGSHDSHSHSPFDSQSLKHHKVPGHKVTAHKDPTHKVPAHHKDPTHKVPAHSKPAVTHSESPGTKVQMDADSLNDFYNQLPQGIPSHQIPTGDEHLYILKSEIVPPVCPACPTFNCPREKPCPPCPACERCPEPAFECKKVPNYNVSNVDEYLPSASNYFSMSKVDNKQPRPLLNDFSQFN